MKTWKCRASNKSWVTYAKVLFLSVLTQFLGGGANFLLGIYLVRTLSISEFGFYGIGFSAILFFAGIGDALFLTQMVIRSPDIAEAERDAYYAQVFKKIAMFSGLAFCVACVFLPIFLRLEYSGGGVFSIVFASIAYLKKDFFIRLAYTKRKESEALALNGVIALVLSVVFFCLEFFEFKISGSVALWGYGFSNMAGAIMGLFLSKLPWFYGKIDFNEWKVARWSLAGVVVNWLQSQAYVYMAVILLGAYAVGQINAGKLMVSPFFFLIPAINQILIPRIATLRVENKSGVFGYSVKVTKITLIFSFLYVAMLAAGYDFFSQIFPGGNSYGTKEIVYLWCLFMMIQIVRNGASNTLLTLSEFRYITFANALSGVVAVLAIWWGTNLVGVGGGVLGAVVGELVLGVLLWRKVIACVNG